MKGYIAMIIENNVPNPLPFQYIRQIQESGVIHAFIIREHYRMYILS